MNGYGHRNHRLLPNGGRYLVKMSIWSLRRSNCSSKILLQMGKPKSISDIMKPNIRTRNSIGCDVGITGSSILTETPISASWLYAVEVKIHTTRTLIQSSSAALTQILKILQMQYQLV